MTRSRYRLFEVTGLEIEYPIVDAEMRPRCLVLDAFRAMTGRKVSDVDLGAAGLSNELAAHVVEVKNPAPKASLVSAERALLGGVRKLSHVLESRFGARLLPTGMHPLMKPSETELWPIGHRRVYEAYARLFDIRQHGWMNVQSCHVNLPFGTEEETVALHDAAAMLLPYLPALAASSPFVEGKPGRNVDNRLAFYRTNQATIPIVTGEVIPEPMGSFREYRRDVLGGIYRALDEVRDGRVLKHEWMNSRGVIPRWERQALEIRVLDAQECVRMDVAVACFVRGALRALTREVLAGELPSPPHAMLVRDYEATVKRGRAARVKASHLVPKGRKGRPLTAQDILELLLLHAAVETPEDELPYLVLVARRLDRGNLSERIAARVKRKVGRTTATRRAAIRGVYEELAACLLENAPWEG